ncbi:reverse transcriptase family protein [Ectopseudomonas mendocina]|uniref:reverse transcriptase family protein n=1 Tax=Ectopseudomonas mendocina TaxID=300 RepID=UPI000F6B472D|nr:reverse transcriptase family protein [Pseudomonas mendocina]VEE16342.1 retron reverse transcriptase [Pseudomonas mendocina]
MKRTLAHREFKAASGSISSISNLAKALNLQVSDFERLWEIPEESRYKSLEKPKTSGGMRVVYNPCPQLRLIQRRINTRIFSNPYVIRWPSYLYGSIPSSPNKSDINHSRDYVACARLHCEAKSILKLDIQNFFDNIHEKLVIEIFSDILRYPEDVSEILARICTYKSRLVQGALTSSYLAMLSLYKEEPEIVAKLKRKDLVYTRFVDDITVSSKIANYDFSYAQKIIEDMLSNAEFPVNSKKTQTQYASASPLTVHGLRVCYKEPRLPSREISNIRAAIRSLEIASKHGNYRQTYAYRKDHNRCLGRANKLARVKHPQHSKFVARLSRILPLPSQKEVNYVKSSVEILERDYLHKKDSFRYKRHYYRTNDRLNVVQRSYPSLVRDLRKRLRPIKPTYE